MVVRPKKNFRHVSWSSMETLDKTRNYWATKATNQPDCEAKGLIWVENFLLNKDEYDVVGEESEPKTPSPDFLFCWWA